MGYQQRRLKQGQRKSVNTLPKTQDLNADTIRTDIPTSATVTNVLVWNVEQSGTNDFTVAYEVDQQVKEGEQTQGDLKTTP